MQEPFNTAAVNQARQLVQQQLGSLSDLPEEFRNTIANIYYEFMCFRIDMNIDGPQTGHEQYYVPEPRKGEDPLQTMKRWGERHAHVLAAVENLPEIIRGMRDMSKRHELEGYEAALRLSLAIFKYGISKVDGKSGLRLRFEMLTRRATVREIKDLWKLF